ncbi:hypothetical protein ANO11243_049970 [Dothideomycetidae sp. 11243]|nr:hypothetical protein ANO11243_049970 [fungal sp. No.11243]
MLSQYYTNPSIHVPNKQARANVWNNPNDQMMIYSRGWIYLTRADQQIQQKSRGKRSLDDLVMQLLDNMRDDGDFSMTAWSALMAGELGDVALTELEDMVNGAVVRLLPTISMPPLEILREDREVLDVGFNVSSLSCHIIEGLRPGSRAERAGVKEGDRILESISLWILAADYDMNNVMTLSRPGKPGGDIFVVEYWPRSGIKVECYQCQ